MRWLRVLVALGVCSAFSCYDTTGGTVREIMFDNSCKVVDSAGKELPTLKLKTGDTVRWCNRGTNVIFIGFSTHKILSGATSLRLNPGECVERRVGTLPYDYEYKWEFKCVDNDRVIKGSGGGPEKVDNPPPPPPGG